MAESGTVAEVEQKLDEIVTQLKNTHGPGQKRALLNQMRALMAELDKPVYDHARFPQR